MSRSDDTTADKREQTGTKNRDLQGMIRRVLVTVTSGPFWQTVGLLLLDGVTKETVPVENFSGIGFYSRPAPGANAEAIVAHCGGRSNPAIVATRDEENRRRMAKIDQDETALYNTQVGVYVTKDGHVEARTPGGTAHRLPTIEELNDLRAFVAANMAAGGHTHAAPGGATTSVVAVGTIPTDDYPGTDVLRGE